MTLASLGGSLSDAPVTAATVPTPWTLPGNLELRRMVGTSVYYGVVPSGSRIECAGLPLGRGESGSSQ